MAAPIYYFTSKTLQLFMQATISNYQRYQTLGHSPDASSQAAIRQGMQIMDSEYAMLTTADMLVTEKVIVYKQEAVCP